MGKEGGESDFNFLKAGLRQTLQPKSISPLGVKILGDEIVGDSDADDEEEVIEAGDQVERLALGKEGAVVRKLIDPKLPTQEEVEEHYLRGHFPYRNWCNICVKAKGREMSHQKEGGKERKIPEYHFDYCFPGDVCDSNGRFWWEKNEFRRPGWQQQCPTREQVGDLQRTSVWNSLRRMGMGITMSL